jgi:hypothetical protein
MKYNFQEQVGDERQREAVGMIAAYWKDMNCDVVDVSEDPQYYSRGIDLIRKYEGKDVMIDVKCDFLAHKTGNIPLEFIEVCPLDESKNAKIGWAYKRTLDEIQFLVWDTKELFVFPRRRLLEYAFGSERRAFASLHHNPIKYFTLGVLLPIEELRKEFSHVTL